MRKNSFAHVGKAAVGIGAVLVATVIAGVTTTRLPVARAAEAFAVARAGGLGAQSTGAVHVNGRVVMRLRDTARDGSGAGQAEDVARRLNELNQRGALTTQNIRVQRQGNNVQLMAGSRLIVDISPQQARAAGLPASNLAESWRNNLVLALRQGSPIAADRDRDRRNTAVRQTPVALQRPAEETRTKIVPILTIGSSFRAGVAQVTGPVSRVDEVKAVARLDTDYKDAVRIAVLVPVASENVVSNVRRVPQVSISAVGDLKL